MLLRIGGRRELGQVTTTDIVVMILIANAVQNAMVGTDQLAWAVVDPAGRIRYKTRGGTVHLTPTRVSGA